MWKFSEIKSLSEKLFSAIKNMRALNLKAYKPQIKLYQRELNLLRERNNLRKNYWFLIPASLGSYFHKWSNAPQRVSGNFCRYPFR